MDLDTPKTPQEILPLEVWELILDHLRSPSDLINCNKVCKAWRKLLELKKTTFLMPKVFGILYKYLQIVEDNEENVDEEDENEEEKESTITTILKMRLVSHGWKESVDNYHQNHPAVNKIGFEELREEQKYEYFEPFPLVPYCFGSFSGPDPIARMESFLGKMFSPDSNPFITRYVEYGDRNEIDQFQSNLQTGFKNILEAFGSQIWACVLNLRIDTTNANFYKLVRSYLNLMPNLRSLQIDFFRPYDEENLDKGGLELLLKNEPLPRLEHLTSLEMSHAPYPLSVGLLANNGHLRKLSFRNDNPEIFLPDYIANVKLPTLMQLEFACHKKELFSFPKMCWPITELHLNVLAAKLENVFQVVSSNFSNTLEHFVLRYHKKELTQTRLDLPKLKKFQFEIILHKVETIDFLQGCTALQEIQLAFYVSQKDKEPIEGSSGCSPMDEVEEDNEVIHFKDCITSMNRSNIWQILHKLECIKIKMNVIEDHVYPRKIHKFTRRQFEKFANAN